MKHLYELTIHGEKSPVYLDKTMYEHITNLYNELIDAENKKEPPQLLEKRCDEIVGILESLKHRST